jgi:hypothetical protein
MVLNVPIADKITAAVTELRNLMPKETLRDVLAIRITSVISANLAMLRLAAVTEQWMLRVTVHAKRVGMDAIAVLAPRVQLMIAAVLPMHRP